MRCFAVFHCNLYYSSIDVERRTEVIQRCYRPLLAYAEATRLPLGIEATGLTLELLAELAPEWIDDLRRMQAAGTVEFIGSGYAQLIGPLCPSAVNLANLRLGQEVYHRLLGRRPTLALINEQAYSAGLVPLYAEAGYEALLMDYENPAATHPEWPEAVGFQPQYALGPENGVEAPRRLPLLWSRSIAFQKLQRVGHGELAPEEYLDWLDGVLSTEGAAGGCLALYGNDAEVFGFRPGRYTTEAPPSRNEWARVFATLAQATAPEGRELVLPSQALAGLQEEHPHAGRELHLESAAMPVPVKKQAKYNISRWAVTGRDDFGVNTTCRRLARALEARSAEDAAWQRLCRLWSSDFRTHITQNRWSIFNEELQRFAAEEDVTTRNPEPETTGGRKIPGRRSDRFLYLEAGGARAILNTRKGLTLHELAFAAHDDIPIVGAVDHGYYRDIELGADFYSGHMIQEGVGRIKTTDLEWVTPQVLETGTKLEVRCSMSTAAGPLEKWIMLDKRHPAITVRYRLTDWQLPPGRLRLGHVTFLPWNLDPDTLFFRTENGGIPETFFPVAGKAFDHGANVSFLVSAAQAAGMTGGWWEAGDASRAVRVSLTDPDQAVVLLATWRPAAPTFFFRLAHSVLEMDETSAPCTARHSLDLGFRLEPHAPERQHSI